MNSNYVRIATDRFYKYPLGLTATEAPIGVPAITGRLARPSSGTGLTTAPVPTSGTVGDRSPRNGP